MSRVLRCLKWVTCVWLGVVASACAVMFLYEVWKPLAVVLLYVLIPVLLPPGVLVLAVAPTTMSLGALAALGAVAL